MIPDYGGNVRRSSQGAKDALLDEHLDIDETATYPTADEATPPDPEAPAEGAPPDPTAPPPPDYLPPPPTPPTAERGGRGDRNDGGRFSVVVPVLLAALGLAAAVIAWRAGVAGNIADDANRAGLDASRERAATLIINEGLVSRASEAYIDYERDRQRADALTGASSNDQAQLSRMQAVSNWFLVQPQYVDRTGQFQPDQERAALLADSEQQKDIQPQPHFSTADTEYDRLRGLIGAGIVVAFALPFLTLAEIGKGRLRLVSIVAGVLIFTGGLAMAVVAWL